jgi:hypothetical protein
MSTVGLRDSGVLRWWTRGLAAPATLLAAVGLVSTHVVTLAVVTLSAVSLFTVYLVSGVMLRAMEPRAARRTVLWVQATYLLHLAVGLVIASSDALVSFLGPDAHEYQRLALELLSAWTDGTPSPTLSVGKEGYPYLLAATYWLTTPSPAVGVAVNAALAAGCLLLVTDTTRRLFGDGAASIAAPLLALFPAFIIWPAQLLREAAVLFLLALIVNSGVRLTRRVHALEITVYVSAMTLLFTFRGYLGVIIALASIVVVLLLSGRFRRSVTVAIVAVAALAFVVLVLRVGYEAYLSTKSYDLQDVNAVRTSLSRDAGSAFGQDVSVSTPRGALAYLPISVPQFLFGPAPWQVRSLAQVPGLVDAMGWVAVAALSMGAIRHLEPAGRWTTLHLLVPAGAVTIPMSLVFTNFGIVIRQRAQILILVLPLAAYGLDLVRHRRRVVRHLRRSGGSRNGSTRAQRGRM